jgi:hypothetical protein
MLDEADWWCRAIPPYHYPLVESAPIEARPPTFGFYETRTPFRTQIEKSPIVPDTDIPSLQIVDNDVDNPALEYGTTYSIFFPSQRRTNA